MEKRRSQVFKETILFRSEIIDSRTLPFVLSRGEDNFSMESERVCSRFVGVKRGGRNRILGPGGRRTVNDRGLARGERRKESFPREGEVIAGVKLL